MDNNTVIMLLAFGSAGLICIFIAVVLSDWFSFSFDRLVPPVNNSVIDRRNRARSSWPPPRSVRGIPMPGPISPVTKRAGG